MKNINKNLILIGKIMQPIWCLISLFEKKVKLVSPVDNVLIIDFHLIGDIVLLIPLLKEVKKKYPRAKITLFAGPWAKEILNGEGLISNYIEINAPWVKRNNKIDGIKSLIKCIWELRKKNWDIGIEVRGDFRQIFVLFIIGAKRRIGLDLSGAEVLLTDIVKDDGVDDHIINHHFKIANQFNPKLIKLDYPVITLTEAEKLRASNFESYIGFHFGASLPLKRMPLKSAINLINSKCNFRDNFVLFVTPDNKYEIDYIYENIDKNIKSRVELWSGTLREMMVKISRASHMYVMDSGAAHISAALEVDTTVYFGPTQSLFSHPIGKNVAIVEDLKMDCRPCNQIRCINKIKQACLAF
jgi:ADP-heptose:LPS heptosyltransferase